MTSPAQKCFEDFEKLKFSPFESKDVLLDDSNEPDKDFCNNFRAVDMHYYFQSEFLSLSDKLCINLENVSIIHLS